VPTRELAEQVLGRLSGLVKYCETDVLLVNVAGGVTAQLQRCVLTLVRTHIMDPERLCRVLLSNKPDIVIGTPSKVLALLQEKVAHLRP
jgi:ATP-dependent RNA helicase DDX56/DBP9